MNEPFLIACFCFLIGSLLGLTISLIIRKEFDLLAYPEQVLFLLLLIVALFTEPFF